MTFDWLKRSMPRGLYGRTALILVLPIVGLQLLVSAVFIQRHFEGVTRQLTTGVVHDLREIEQIVALASTPDEARTNLAPFVRSQRIETIVPLSDPSPEGEVLRRFYDISGITIVATLRQGLMGLRAVDLSSNNREVRVQLDTKFGVVETVVDRRRASAANPHQFLVIMVFFGIAMTGIAFLYLRNQVRPISRLATAAEAFGKGRVVPYRPSGALEVRAAGAAFLDMRRRIERQIEQRTLMLSGVSHDLRTPLTRLRLELSMLPDGPEVEEMRRDLADMEQLIDAFLDFARGDATESPTPTDPCALAQQVVDQASRMGWNVRLVLPDAPVSPVPIREKAVTRALSNLVGNAHRYATTACVTVETRAAEIRFIVEDDGPGIPADRRAEAVQPFSRLDSARNQDRGPGVGLGLAIARDIARSHGGRLDLHESQEMGGLRIVLALPA